MKVQLTCDYCGSTFEREGRERKRSQRLGRKSFCSRQCCGKANINNNIPLEKRNTIIPISLHSRNRVDEFTPFRRHLRRAQSREKEVDITLEYLRDVWEKQDGICPYSGIKLKTPSYLKRNDPRYSASLDRIDSSKGYVKGNIQFVSAAMNNMKQSMSHEDTIELCKKIAEFWS